MAPIAIDPTRDDFTIDGLVLGYGTDGCEALISGQSLIRSNQPRRFDIDCAMSRSGDNVISAFQGWDVVGRSGLSSQHRPESNGFHMSQIRDIFCKLNQ